MAEEWVFPGQTIAGKYRLEARLGRGGMGEVWRAEHMVLRAPVAVKFINPSLASSGDATSRFLREAQAAAALRSVHVVQILDYGVDQNVPFMVMEFLEGESLGAYLARLGRLTPPDTAHIMTHVGRAMQKAHESGIVHRDLKPENVFLVPTGDELVGKVLDFGIAKVQNPGVALNEQTKTGAIMGTPYYMSPEQVEGNRAIDFRADIWSMGVIAFECLTGRRPFDSDSFGDLVLKICMHPMPQPRLYGEVPAGFDEWFARAVNRNAAERFPSAKDAAGALRRVCLGSSASTWQQAGSTGLPMTAQLLPPPAQSAASAVSVDTAKPVSTSNLTSPSAPPRRRGAAVAVLLAVGATAALAVVAVLAFRNLGTHATPDAPAASQPEAPPPPPAEPQTAAQPPPTETAPAPEATTAKPIDSVAKPPVAPRTPTGKPAHTAARPADKPPATAAPRPTTGPATKPDDLL